MVWGWIINVIMTSRFYKYGRFYWKKCGEQLSVRTITSPDWYRINPDWSRDKLFHFVYSFSVSVDNQLPFTIQEQLIDVYPEFLTELLQTNILEKICHSSFDESDLMLVKIDLNYQKILRLCQLYKNAFQLTYTVIAKKMIQVNTAAVQKFLTTFLNDVKGAMKLSEFPHHYEDELINYVLIFNECKVEDEWIARHFTNKLKESNYLHYFILVTHFPNFLYF